MINVKGLKKKFNELTVLNGIDIVVERGQVLAIIGPSGSGKSTFLRCLNFLEQPDAGLIEIGEAALNAENHTNKEVQQLRQQTAMVFQNYNLFRNKTVLQNVTESLIIAKKMPKVQAEAIALDLLTKVGLKEKAGNYPATLSGGQQQRVAIARSLVNDPVVILADEATGNLDTRTSYEIMALLQDLNSKGKTIVFVTHEPDIAKFMTREVVFRDGHIIREDLITERHNAAELLKALPMEDLV